VNYIDAFVRGEIGIACSDLTDEQVTALRTGLSYDNAAYLSALRRGAPTRFLQPTEAALHRCDGEWRVPRACHKLVQQVVGERLRWIDCRTTGETQNFALQVPVREHQLALGNALIRYQQGIGNGATGGGKTGGACVAIARCAVPTLWIAPTLDLAQQARAEIKRFLGVDAALSIGGKLALAPIIVGTWDTVRKHLDELKSRTGLLVVDEVHGSLGETRIEVVRTIDARYRLGITATLKDEDVRSSLLSWHFGKVIGRYDVADGVRDGVLAQPSYRTLPTQFRFGYRGSDDWAPLQEALFGDLDRMRLIAGDVAQDAAGRLALVLSTRKNHLRDLQALLLGLGVRAELLTGDLPKKEREAVLTRARAGEIEALLCTQLADEGLDLVNADRLYLCAPSKSPSRLLQRIGRIVRAVLGKQPVVVDVVDLHVGPLAHQARTRRKIFESSWGEVMRSAA
jgi:superfamily II DNA or RNA helicase